MDDMTIIPVELPAHTCNDLLRMCANVENDYGYLPVFVQVIRDAVVKAVQETERYQRETRTGLCDRCGLPTAKHYGYCTMDM